MGGNQPSKTKYLVEYLADPDVSKFTTDFADQPSPRVGFHVFGLDSCP
jgi:hypothetical protein